MYQLYARLETYAEKSLSKQTSHHETWAECSYDEPTLAATGTTDNDSLAMGWRPLMRSICTRVWGHFNLLTVGDDAGEEPEAIADVHLLPAGVAVAPVPRQPGRRRAVPLPARHRLAQRPCRKDRVRSGQELVTNKHGQAFGEEDEEKRVCCLPITGARSGLRGEKKSSATATPAAATSNAKAKAAALLAAAATIDLGWFRLPWPLAVQY